MFFHLIVLDACVLNAHEISPMFSQGKNLNLTLYTGCLFANLIMVLKNVSNGANGFVRDFDVEAFRNSFRKPFGIGQNNWTSPS